MGSKCLMTWRSRRKLVKYWPAAMSQSPWSQARFCQPERRSRTLVYSGLMKWLSAMVAGMKRVPQLTAEAQRRGEGIENFKLGSAELCTASAEDVAGLADG